MTERRYRFGPLSRRGLLAGWRSGQVASVAAGLAVAVLALQAHSGPVGVVVAVGAAASSVALAVWPIAGRTGEEWLPTVVRWARDGAMGRRQVRSPSPESGHLGGGAGLPGALPRHAAANRRANRLPRGLAGVAVGAVPLLPGTGSVADRPGDTQWDAHTMGVVSDRAAGAVTAAVEVRGHSFALAGPADQARRIAGWSAMLAGVAHEGSRIHRLQWLASVLPDDGRGIAAHLAERAVLPGDHAARRAYTELLAIAGANACRHEVLVAVQLRTTRSTGLRRARSGAGPGSPGELDLEVQRLCRRLADADALVDAVLGPGDLEAVIRRTGDALPLSGPRPASWSGDPWPWPAAIEEGWDRLRTDATWHATYWIAEWPRTDVGPDFLAPLLMGPVRRTVAVVMEPLAPGVAARRIERARTADLADAELRRRGGFLATARRAREQEVVLRREEELAAGHASFRFSGYVTVTVDDPGRLDEACRATEQAAAQARLELRRLYGDQLRGFTCTLPLCRGLS